MKDYKQQAKNFAIKAVCKLAKNTAIKSANTTCPFYQHQPILPDEVKKLRKF